MYPAIEASATALAAGLPGIGPLRIFFEVPAARGIPDVVIIAFDSAEIERRGRLRLPPVEDVTCLRTLVALSAGERSLAEVARLAEVSSDHLRRNILPRLRDEGWVEATVGRGLGSTVQPLVDHRSLATCVVTVEAKLRDWRRAVGQAHRHRTSSDRSFVALDSAYAEPALQRAGELACGGIGLAVVDQSDGVSRIVEYPLGPTAVRDADRRLLAERAWKLDLDGRNAGASYPVFGRMLTAGASSPP